MTEPPGYDGPTEDEIEDEDYMRSLEEIPCNGLCFTAADVGVGVPGNPIAYPNLLCPVHGVPTSEGGSR